MARKLTTAILTAILVCCLTVMVILMVKRDVTEGSNATPLAYSSSPYESNIVPIDRYVNNSNIRYINISEFYTVASDDTLTIKDPTTVMTEEGVQYKIKINNGLDMYYFGVLCNSEYTEYLTYYYILGQDIDYTDASRYYKMMKYIGWNDPFTGTFDGQGFELKNLFFEKIIAAAKTDEHDETLTLEDYTWTNPNNPDDIQQLELLALFSTVGEGGVIKNLGVVDVNMIQSDSFDVFSGASPLVGENNGLIDHVYVQDLRDNDAGLSVENIFTISGFVTYNNGTISNCYTAHDKIVSASIFYTDRESRFPVVYENYGTLTNVYFDKQTLSDTYTEKEGIVGLNTSQFTNLNDFPYYVDGQPNGWYSRTMYEAPYSSYIRNTYPILKGFLVSDDSHRSFEITNAPDFLYFSQLIKTYDPFRQASYLLLNTIDMDQVSAGSYQLTSTVFRGTLDGGTYVDNGYTIIDKTDKVSTNNSIINLKIDTGVSSNSFRLYGLFAILAGNVRNLNIVLDVTLNDITNEIIQETKAIGGVCGRQEGGVIENVAVYGNISLNNVGTVGTAYVGGIAGYSTSGFIDTVSTSGEIDGGIQNIATSTNPSSIGGIVGYVSQSSTTNGIINNCLNSMDIHAIRYTSVFPNEQYIGGAIGYGEFRQAIGLENDGTIFADVDGYSYGKKYIGGVVGLIRSSTEEIGNFVNNADINVIINTFDIYNYSCKPIVSGCANAISNTTSRMSLVSLSNRGLLNITSSLYGYESEEVRAYTSSTTTLMNVKLAGVLYSENTNLDITGLYNFAQKYYYANGQKLLEEATTQNIDMSIIDRYAPCYNANNSSNAIVVNLSKSYNYQNINYITNGVVKFYNLYLTGNCNGSYINYDNIRNDGNISVYFSHSADTILNAYSSENQLNDWKKLKVYGCFEEVSGGSTYYYTAKNIYNGGDIRIGLGDNLDVRYNLYASGICYQVRSGESFFNHNNMDVTDIMITSGVEGMLHNSINAGLIYADCYKGSSSNYSLYGVSRLSGIASSIGSLVTSCFNLGDVYNRNAILTKGDRGAYADAAEFEVESAGISFTLNRRYAQIRDCANNGNIYAINMSTSAHSGLTWTNAGGIIVRNDRDERGCQDITDTTGQTYQKIQFTINYGNIYSYNERALTGYDTTYDEYNETLCKAAGFSCIGVLSIVNVINYGNVYSSRAAGGMFGVVFTNKFNNIFSADNPVYIANAINYGDIGKISLATAPVTYPDMNNNDTIASNSLSISIEPSGNAYPPYGALIGIMHATGNIAGTLQMINVSYLINFNERVNIIGGVHDFGTSTSLTGNNLTAVQNTLRYMATTKDEDTSPFPFKYAASNIGIASYSKDTASPDYSVSNTLSKEYNGGIINEAFSLRNPASIDNSIITNQYIADYIQFIPYSKVNDYLVNKIGLTASIYANALNAIYENDEAIRKIVAKYVDSIEANSQLDTFFNNTIRNSYTNDTINSAIINDNIDALTDNEAYDLLLYIIQSDNEMITSILNNNEFMTDLKEMYDLNDEEVLQGWKDIIAGNSTLLPHYADELLTYLHQNVQDLSTVYDLLAINAIIETAYNNSSTTDTENLVIQIVQYFISLEETTTPPPTTLQEIALNLGYVDDPEVIINTLVNDYPEYEEAIREYLIAQLDISNNQTAKDLIRDKYFDTYVNNNNNLNTIINSASTSIINAYQNIVGSGNYLYIPADENKYGLAINSVTLADESRRNSADYPNDFYTGPYAPPTNGTTLTGGVVYGGNGTSYISTSSQTYMQYTGSGRYSYNTNNRNFTYNALSSNSDYTNTSGTNVYMNVTRSGSWLLYVYTVNGYGTHWRFAYSEISNLFNTSEYNWTNETKRNIIKSVKNEIDLSSLIIDSLSVQEILTLFEGREDLLASALEHFKNTPEYGGELIEEAAQQYYAMYIANQAVSNISQFTKLLTMDAVKNNLSEEVRFSIIKYLFTNSPNTSFVALQNTDGDINYIELFIDSLDVASCQELFDILYPDNVDRNIIVSMITTLQNANNLDAKTLLKDILANNKKEVVDGLVNRGYLSSEAKKDIATSVLFATATLDRVKNWLLSQGINVDLLDPETAVQMICELIEMDFSNFTDNTGIYALASSAGIDNGEFIPDNIRLILLDKYVEEDGSNDPTWRGGTNEAPDSYSPTDTNSVNYKVYYEMKQLKKSIATTVFKIELVDDVNNTQFVLNNDITSPTTPADYDLANNTIRFYLPINDVSDSELTTLNVNTTPGRYELANLASFQTTNPIVIPQNVAVGDVLTNTIIVQAEDTTVTREYTIEVIIIAAKELELTSASVNDANSNFTLHEASNINATISNSLSAFDGKLEVSYTTSSIPINTSFSSKINVYKLNITSLPTTFDYQSLIQDGTEASFQLDNSVYNAIVQNAVFNASTSTWGEGTLSIAVSLDNVESNSSGYYLLEVEITPRQSSYVIFYKTPSTANDVLTLTYNGEYYENLTSQTNNQSAPSHTPFGTYLGDVSDMSYLENYTISPWATISSVANPVYQNGVWTVAITVVSESGASKVFTHYIQEEDFDPSIAIAYRDGGLIASQQTGTVPTEYNFDKYSTPAYTIGYNLAGLDATANNISFLINGEPSSNYDSQLAIYYVEGVGFEVTFFEEALSMPYEITMRYQKTEGNVTWLEDFTSVTITKDKNIRSYLENITFTTETILAALDTIADIQEISVERYNQLRNSTDREIVCLPSGIYYNQYEQDINKQDDFYIIGLVSRTVLSYYSPNFTIPSDASIYRITTISGAVYRYVPYLAPDGTEVVALVDEAGTTVIEVDAVETSISLNADQSFTYQGLTYTLSPLAGKTSLDTEDGTTLTNNSLNDDFSEANEETFDYKTYRVYSEAYDAASASSYEYYTDYNIAVQDITNNVRFEITIYQDTNINLYSEAHTYLTLENYQNGLENGYAMLNKMSMFAYFVDNQSQLTHSTFTTNTAGRYTVKLDLPVGYGFVYKAWGGTIGEATDFVPSNTYIDIESRVVTQVIYLEIKIIETQDGTDWGQTSHVDSSDVYDENNGN